MSACDELNQPRIRYRVEYVPSGMIYEEASLGDVARNLYESHEATGMSVKEWASLVSYNCSRIFSVSIQIDYTSDETIFESIGVGFVRAGFFKVISPQMPIEVQ